LSYAKMCERVGRGRIPSKTIINLIEYYKQIQYIQIFKLHRNSLERKNLTVVLLRQNVLNFLDIGLHVGLHVFHEWAVENKSTN